MTARYIRNRKPKSLDKGRRPVHKFELLAGEAIVAMLVVVVGSFLLAGVARVLISSSQTAAVVSSILVDLTNADRTAHNVGNLRVNPALVAAAQAKANDMATKGYFAHTAPDGTDPWYWFREAGYPFEYAGENLAIDFSDSLDVERAWMNSPAHRDNILDPHYTEIGIAMAEGMYEGRRTIFVVQEFGKPQDDEKMTSSIVSSEVPPSPEVIATAEIAPRSTVGDAKLNPAAQSEQTVLGTSVQTDEATGPKIAISQSPKRIPSNSFDIAAATPVWYAFSAPRDTLRSVYFALTAFLLLVLAFTTRFEMKKHHLRHVGAVLGLVVTMGGLFFLASYYVFTSPLILDRGAAAMHQTN